MATQQEHDIWATLERTKSKVENLMAQMETALGNDPVSILSLRRKFSKVEDIWAEYESLYEQLRAITEEDQAERDHDNFNAFKDRYSDVYGRADDAIEDDRSAEEACLAALASKKKVQQYQAGWKAVHTCIEKALEEIETSLGGEAIATLEELEVEEVQLRQVKESLEESTSLVDAIISEDPNQAEAMKDAEAVKSVSADAKI